jgi:hypothetical protein
MLELPDTVSLATITIAGWTSCLLGGFGKCNKLGYLPRHYTRSLQPCLGPATVGSDASTVTRTD